MRGDAEIEGPTAAAEFNDGSKAVLNVPARLAARSGSWLLGLLCGGGLFLPSICARLCLSRRHQIHYRSQLLRLLDRRNFSALRVWSRSASSDFPGSCLYIFRIPLVRQSLDELVCHSYFRMPSLHVGRAKAFHLLHFLGVIHRVPASSRRHEAAGKTVYSRLCIVILVMATYSLSSNALVQQRIRTPPSLFRHHVIRRLEIHGIDVARLNEFQNLHGLSGLRLDLLISSGSMTMYSSLRNS